MSEILNTPFTQKHIALGAKMAPFAGYNMPISYTGINDEHAAVRNAAGVFDFETGLKIVKKRGELMFSIKDTSMAAVIGTNYKEIQEIL